MNSALGQRRVLINVEQGDVLSYEADVLALKHAQSLHGADRTVVERLRECGVTLSWLPDVGDYRLIQSEGCLAAKYVMFVGVEPLGRWFGQFGYQEVRKLAQNTLEILAGVLPEARHVSLTLHGPGFGLDEIEAFEAEIAGLIDSLTRNKIPKQLERVTIVERDDRRVARLKQVLPDLVPNGFVEVDLQTYMEGLGDKATETYRSAGYASESKPRIFVAMPFAEELDDTFHYGIQGAVQGAGFLCERADQSVFTGDVMEWVKQRIESSNLIVADLSTANPNVYLEIGYAWGCGKRTVLLLHESEEKFFDVRGQKLLTYKTIRDLEKKLGAELNSLQRQVSL